MVQHGTLAQQDLSPLSKPSWEPWGTMGNHGGTMGSLAGEGMGWQFSTPGGLEFQSGESGEIFRAPPGISGDLEQGDLAVVAPASC